MEVQLLSGALAVLGLIGDMHTPRVLRRCLAKMPADAVPIQVGDFGWWPYTRQEHTKPDRFCYFIDGNHDHVPKLQAGECDWPGIGYIPRGEVHELDGRRILFLGGATSVDRDWRPHQAGPHAWFDEEVISEYEAAMAIAHGAGGVDLMITHTPPDWMIRKHFSPDGLRHFNIDPDTWRDDAALRVEQVWRALGEPPLYCGHMHRSVTDGNCRILNIEEVVLV